MAEIEKPPLVSEAERRKARKRVFFGGKIVHSKGMFSIDCTIRDVSETGAKVGLNRNAQIPTDVFFIDLKAGTAHEAQVIWRRPPNLGLKFVRPIDLQNPPEELSYLQRLWRSSKGRGA